ncbi:hypothetical protein [Actinomadura sp. WAC 06369]|uniref:hypothetical protein n=1 Tax=Actinomadura sp. WAC 06369 TaxID=2203193 RepID=UPI000F7B42B9|nr:hypothetical protein [Actinomadura sp. WAC 06369]RSN41037.1 hypothetical protein DMH08_39140 [Actinomadura sp. WAC 06369]
MGLFGGRAIPGDVLVAVGAPDAGRPGSTFVVGVGAAGLARVQYTAADGSGPLWMRRAEVGERRRRRVLRRVLAVVPERPAGRGQGAAPYGWVSVSAGGAAAWVPLSPDQRVGGVAVVALVGGLVPADVWAELRAREAEWRARQAGQVPGGPVPDPAVLEGTRRDWGVPVDADATRHDAATSGPWDRRVAGAPAEDGGLWTDTGYNGGPRSAEGEGWPGIRHGQGRGGVW